VTGRERAAIVVAAIASAVAVVATCLAVSGRLGSKRAEIAPGETLYREVLGAIERDYVVEPNVERVVYGAAKGAMAELKDPHSKVLDPVEWEKYRRDATGEASGPGFELALIGDAAFVAAVTPGGPAEAAGLPAGRRVVALDGREVDAALGLPAIERALFGPEGTPLLVSTAAPNGGDRRETKIVRARYDAPTVYERRLDAETSHVRIVAFRDGTADEFRKIVDRAIARGVKAYVLDLRFNRGGAFEPATEIADLFVVDGVLCSVEGRRRSETLRATSTAPLLDAPTIVLTDGETASAAEVLAGALQDRHAAVVVGESTYGKGVVQEVRAFASWGGGLKITTARYYTPSGRCLEARALGDDEAKGGRVRPDVALRATDAERAATKRRLERFHWHDDVREATLQADGDDRFADRALAAARGLLKGLPATAGAPEIRAR
jgi:carboxyl-terminal processing protease